MLLLYILNLYSVRYEYEDFVKNIKFHMFYFWLKKLDKIAAWVYNNTCS